MTSWIDSANVQNCPFPLQNLPYGVFRHADGPARCGVAIGDLILDLAVLDAEALLPDLGETGLFERPALNAFMARGNAAWQALRECLTDLLAETGNSRLRDDSALQKRCLVPMADATLQLPFTVAEYTDFYAGRQHAFNVGTMFRGPENALPPNWLHIPIGYNGRASTVVVSGTDIRRPLGQLKPNPHEPPIFAPCRRLDIELEMGAVVGLPNEMGNPISVSDADEMIFGYVLLNDWSARDIQAWEYQPLGPFQAKAFATTISPWVVTKAALEPFRISTPDRERPLLPYLQEPRPLLYDINLEVHMQPAGAAAGTRLSQTNYRNMYYSAAQQLAHHAVSGCAMRTGDLLGSGTISGDDPSQYGSLLEMSWGGKNPLTLDNGETRTFIEDGDTLTLTGWSQGTDYRVGFGACTGTILPSPRKPEWTS